MLFGVTKTTRAELLTGGDKNNSNISNSSPNVSTVISQWQLSLDSSYEDFALRSQRASNDSTWSVSSQEMSTSVPSVPPDPHFEEALYYLQLLQPDAGNNTTNLLYLQQFANLTQGVDLTVVERFSTNLRVSEACLVGLLIAYAALMAVGAVGNCLVVAAVARNAALRTARNLLLFNLAVSDVLLCVLTMPLTLLEVVTQHWPLGAAACRAAGSLQAIAVFSSTFTIVAIALDRHMVIVHPTRAAMGIRGVMAAIVTIWLAASFFALPNLLYRHLEVYETGLKTVPSVAFCYERWPPALSRACYSVATLTVQFFLPILTVSIAHCGISQNLKRRRARNKQSKVAKSSKIRHDEETAHSNNISVTIVENTTEQRSSGNLYTMGFSKPVHSKPATEGDPRRQKVNQLLCAITIVFCVSWLPLNVFNCIIDVLYPNHEATESTFVLYAACHLCGMSSACSNPFLYGWLNNNFRSEFSAMFACRFQKHFSWFGPSNRSHQLAAMKEPRSKLSIKSTRVSSAVPLSSFAKVSGSHVNGAAPLETSLNEAAVLNNSE